MVLIGIQNRGFATTACTIAIKAGPRKPSILLKRSYEADPDGSPNRQKIEWKMHIRTGDIIDFLVNPRGNHDCDGLYIVDIQIWTDDT